MQKGLVINMLYTRGKDYKGNTYIVIRDDVFSHYFKIKYKGYTNEIYLPIDSKNSYRALKNSDKSILDNAIECELSSIELPF